MRATGQSISLAFMGAIFALASGSNDILSSLFKGAGSVGAVQITAYVSGMKEAFLVCALISVVGAMFSLVRGGHSLENAETGVPVNGGGYT